jgi:hypothetical protein
MAARTPSMDAIAQVKAIIYGPVSPLTPLFAMHYLIFRFILQELKLSTSQFPLYTELKSFQRSTFQTVTLTHPPPKHPFLPSLCETGLSLLQWSFRSHNPDCALWCIECRLLDKWSFCQELQEVFNNLSLLTPAPVPPNFKAAIRNPLPFQPTYCLTHGQRTKHLAFWR